MEDSERLANKLDIAISGCVIIGKATQIAVFVIPGLTRNPVFFQRSTLLDAPASGCGAGLSSPA